MPERDLAHVVVVAVVFSRYLGSELCSALGLLLDYLLLDLARHLPEEMSESKGFTWNSLFLD